MRLLKQALSRAKRISQTPGLVVWVRVFLAGPDREEDKYTISVGDVTDGEIIEGLPVARFEGGRETARTPLQPEGPGGPEVWPLI